MITARPTPGRLSAAVCKANSGRTEGEVRITRMHRLAQEQRRKGKKTVRVKLVDLEALVVAAVARKVLA